MLAASAAAEPRQTQPTQATPAESPLLSRAERTNFDETSRAADIDAFLLELARRTDLLRVQTFGQSEEGRPLLLATLSNPPVTQAREIQALGRPVVLIEANIHGGEVEGKEACLHLMRRLALGDLRPLLDSVVVLLIPNYNADGNEAIDVMNRTPQNGPVAGVGRRENARGLDLNRDFMKLESSEARSLIGVLNEFDPHVVVDLHTTNGSYHGYHLTYSIPVNESFAPELLRFERETLMPALGQAMLERHNARTYYYGNFEGKPPAEGRPDTRSWVAFDHRPRIGQNYVGLRNRIAILSEAYSYLDFRERVRVTEGFVTEILTYVSAHASAIRELTGELDRSFVAKALTDEPIALGVEYVAKALPTKVPMLVGQVTTKLNPRSGKEMRVALTDVAQPVEMLDYASFEPTRTVLLPDAYVLPSDARVRPLIDKLLLHGITVEVLTESTTVDVTRFAVESTKQGQQQVQGHRERTVTGHDVTSPETLPAGTILVRVAQPLGRLAAYLLEPESDDGLVAWNYLDALIAPEATMPIGKLMRLGPIASRRFAPS
jgi:hypothetical protein